MKCGLQAPPAIPPGLAVIEQESDEDDSSSNQPNPNNVFSMRVHANSKVEIGSQQEASMAEMSLIPSVDGLIHIRRQEIEVCIEN